jgi:hypothetical protein
VNSHCDVIAQRFFKGPRPSAEYLEQVTQYLIAMRFDVTLEPVLAPALPGRVNSRVEPIIGKAEVIAAAEAGEPFPREANRHLVDGRPVGMSIPLASLSRPEDFGRHVDDLFEHRNPALAGPGVRHDGRQYDERVTLFAPARVS